MIYRVCSQKDIIGSWEDTAKVLNELLDCEYTESKYRKQYQAFQKMFSANKERFADSEKEIAELNEKQRELLKERQKLFDERCAYKKLIREQARNETLVDQV